MRDSSASSPAVSNSASAARGLPGNFSATDWNLCATPTHWSRNLRRLASWRRSAYALLASVYAAAAFWRSAEDSFATF